MIRSRWAHGWLGALAAPALVIGVIACEVPSGSDPPAPNPAALVKVDGDGQRGRTGFVLPTPITVRVVDASGAPVAGSVVRWTATGPLGSVGVGTVSPLESTSDSDGRAATSWTLGVTGAHQLRATVSTPAADTAVVFTAHADPGVVVTVYTSPRELYLQPGEVDSIRVYAVDRHGASPKGVKVSWTSSDPSVATVDSAGRVRTLRTGGATITPTADGVQGSARAWVLNSIRVNQFTLGSDHACASTAGGGLACWGDNQTGALGTGSTGRTWTAGSEVSNGPAVAAAQGRTFTQVSAGNRFTCGVDGAGEAWCWGKNDDGQLGNGSTQPSAVPVRMAGGLAFRAVAAGYAHACGITTDSNLYCWGDNEFGGLGNGTTVSSPVPARVAGAVQFVSVSAGTRYTCALATDGAAYCWGDSGSGRLGTGSTAPASTPMPVTGGLRFRSLSAGWSHTCAVAVDGVAYCWGYSLYGQTGRSSPMVVLAPTSVPGIPALVSISAGTMHSCGLAADGAAYCWGNNLAGQMGTNTRASGVAPARVHATETFISLQARYNANCGLTSAGELRCWGSGPLGNPTNVLSCGVRGSPSYACRETPLPVLVDTR